MRYYCLLSTLFLTILFTIKNSNCDNKLEEINDSNYSKLVSSYSKLNEKWLLIFYLPSCPHCKIALEQISKLASNRLELNKNEEHLDLDENNNNNKTDKEDHDNNNNINFGKIDCDVNTLLCVSYDIKQVPYIVKIENNRMIVFKSYPSIPELNKFIKAEHDESDTYPVPEMLSYVYFGLKLLHEGLNLFSEYINNFLQLKNINLKWTNQYSLIAFAVFLVILIIFEILLITCCCNKISTKRKNIENKILKNDKNDLNNSEEVKDKSNLEDSEVKTNLDNNNNYLDKELKEKKDN